MPDALNLLVPVTYFGFLLAERIWPARGGAPSFGWTLKGVFFFALSGVIHTTLPALFASVTRDHHVFELTRWGTWGSALVLLLASELVGYAWHRARHASVFFWRALHQMHHSAERLDVSGSMFAHPLDTVSLVVVGMPLMLLFGVTPAAGALFGYIGFLLAVFQHLNVKTPRWLGYFVQRPEAHAVHHQRGVHAFNYSNLPLIDWLFGTYRNPERFEGELGFWDGASARTLAMLAGMDVSELDSARAESDATLTEGT